MHFLAIDTKGNRQRKQCMMLTSAIHVERLGHCICYKGPSYFKDNVFNLMKSLAHRPTYATKSSAIEVDLLMVPILGILKMTCTRARLELHFN